MSNFVVRFQEDRHPARRIVSAHRNRAVYAARLVRDHEAHAATVVHRDLIPAIGAAALRALTLGTAKIGGHIGRRGCQHQLPSSLYPLCRAVTKTDRKS